MSESDFVSRAKNTMSLGNDHVKMRHFVGIVQYDPEYF